jgi:hypothetical protein
MEEIFSREKRDKLGEKRDILGTGGTISGVLLL